MRGILYEADTLDEMWPKERPHGEYPGLDSRMYLSEGRPVNYSEQER